MNNSNKIANFISPFKLDGDGTGFWDSYEGQLQWLGNKVSVSIAVRNISEEIVSLYEKIMLAQEKYDALWKQYAVEKLWNEMQDESIDEALTKSQLLELLEVSEITFGFDRDGLMSVWLISPEQFCEHAPLVYCDQDGVPYAAVMEG